ncbi:hypothetical protein PaG_02856 [Moesziomyces aphidis]|uniref:peptidyl-tRNA hydrolase n=1 Tax=Moesziomyces aphidis TaxID=84754 RepID=W3VQL8_MOEAP|nr:hypothetical protein PaG_02856 [Moesziomyces aphidis]
MSISTSASGAMLPTLVAVSIASLTIGYFVGMGRSLVSYNANSRRILQDDDSSDDEDLDDATASTTEECKMILAVRMDLKMEKGKIAAQCGHATLAVYKLARRITPAFVKQWETLGQAKVAVKCPDEPTMLELESKAKELGIAARSIIDAYVLHTLILPNLPRCAATDSILATVRIEFLRGRTQIAPNSRTVLGLGPAPVSLMNQLTGHLKLL